MYTYSFLRQVYKYFYKLYALLWHKINVVYLPLIYIRTKTHKHKSKILNQIFQSKYLIPFERCMPNRH